MFVNIKTDSPFLHEQEKITTTIANFWDQTSQGWHTVWGPHIHHGFYETNDSLTPSLTPIEAQEKLIEKLSDMLTISSHSHILDVGCGMGGSSLHLAKKYNAFVSGITLSQEQMLIATQKSRSEKITNVNFKVEDALSLTSFANNSVDIVWSLESCEQFYNKNLFIDQAFRVLKPGGQLMLATWCSDREEYEGRFAKKYRKLCLAFDLPYMPTIDYYSKQLNNRGFAVKASLDWSVYVKKSWDVGLSLINAYSFWQIVKISGWRGLTFAYQIKMMRDAFLENRVQYGVFLATKMSNI
jgi:tocopherol O-methyltransferase